MLIVSAMSLGIFGVPAAIAGWLGPTTVGSEQTRLIPGLAAELATSAAPDSFDLYPAEIPDARKKRPGRNTMQADEIRFLFAYDRWATRRVLSVLDGLDPAVWTRKDVVGERGLGAILVHHLGASQRWRHGFQQTGESPEPEREPLPTLDQLRERWNEEWAVVDAWLPTVTDGFVGYVHEEVPVWQMLVHVVNHGTQHRAEAAALLTAEGRSPGELDLINYVEERAGAVR
jgi:uncharacterized damage-inducible protein DinB